MNSTTCFVRVFLLLVRVHAARQRQKETVEGWEEKLWYEGMRGFGWLARERADQISLGEVGKACQTYVMLLGHGARRGVNNAAVKWDGPAGCLVTNILGRKAAQTRPAFQRGNRGWPHEHGAS